MKEKYIAPDLYFESFVLSKSIAAGCSEMGITLTKSFLELYFLESHSQYACSQEEGKTIWTDEVSGVAESYCVTQGADAQKGFLS